MKAIVVEDSRLAREGLVRMLQALPVLEVVAQAGDPATELQRAVHDFCHAASENDTERMRELRQAVQRMGVPTELLPVFRE